MLVSQPELKPGSANISPAKFDTCHLGGVVVSVLTTGPKRLRVQNPAKAMVF
jgi:hypothetical protein